MSQESPCDRCTVLETIQQNSAVEAEQKGLDGRDYQIFSAPLPEADGPVNKAIEIVMDITERKQLEDKLKKSEEKYKSLVEHVREIIFMHDSDYILTYVSPQCEKITGYAAQELIGQRWDSFATDNPMNELALDILEEARETGKPSVPHQVEVRKKDGDVIVLEVNDRILRNAEGKITGVVGSARDITKQKLMQEALREQQEKAQKYLDVAGVMFVVLDANGTVTLVNKKGCEVLGYKEDEIIGRNWFDNYLPERLKNDVTQVLNKLMTGEIEPVEYYENPVLTKDGKEKLIAWHNTILKDSLGNITGILSSGSDITKRKRSEEAMKKSSIIIDSTTDAVITTDIAGNITFWNKGAEIIYGYPKEEVIGKSISIIYKDQDLHVLESMIVELMERKDIPGIEVTCIDKNKQDIEILLSLTSIRDEEGNVIELVGITKDITERKKAERRIQEYQRQLKSLASELVLAEERERRRIATGLHDDIAQKLAMAKFGLQSLQASMADTDLSQSLEKQCQLMGQIVEDARSLTFELSNPLLYQVGLEAAVESHLVKHIQDEFGIECKFGSEGPHSSLDDDIKIVVFQAVRELLANVIKHANANKLEVCIINSENELKIVVEDDGVGFDPAQIGPHAVGESGFGLFNIRERLEYLGGNLEIESGREKGACVIMNIPIRADAVAR